MLTESKEEVRHVCIDIQSDDKRTTYSALLNSEGNEIQLSLKNPVQRKYIEELYVRRIQINILRKTGFKVISKSPNVYYEPNPLPSDEDVESDIVAYRRYYVFRIF